MKLTHRGRVVIGSFVVFGFFAVMGVLGWVEALP